MMVIMMHLLKQTSDHVIPSVRWGPLCKKLHYVFSGELQAMQASEVPYICHPDESCWCRAETC